MFVSPSISLYGIPDTHFSLCLSLYLYRSMVFLTPISLYVWYAWHSFLSMFVSLSISLYGMPDTPFSLCLSLYLYRSMVCLTPISLYVCLSIYIALWYS